MRQRRGFSLIELLVVIAIIAILAAILFPIFMAAQTAAKKTGCSSNFKQIAYAYRMYMADYNDFYPSNHFGANLFLVEPYLKSKKFKVGADKWADSVWLCPAAKKGSKKALYYIVGPEYWDMIGATPPWGSGTVMVFNSYTINSDVTTKSNYGPRNCSDVPEASKTVLFAEGCDDRAVTGVGTSPTASHPTGEPWEVTGWCKHHTPGSRSEIHPWHSGGANFLYVDLHITFHRTPPPLNQWQVPIRQ